MTREEFDQLSEAETRALLKRKAEALLEDARTNDLLRAWCQRQFGEAPPSTPLEDTLATNAGCGGVADVDGARREERRKVKVASTWRCSDAKRTRCGVFRY
jgi:hypothetical protein